MVTTFIECLEDGSLVYLGEIKKETYGYIMFFDPTLLLSNIKTKLAAVDSEMGGIALVINSLARKKMLKDTSEKEIKTIKSSLGDNFKVIGLYAGYSLFSNKKIGDIDIETNNLLIATCQ